MMVLDTDHFSEFLKGVSRSAKNLRSRLASAATPVAVSIVTGEEMMRGWLAQIHANVMFAIKSILTAGCNSFCLRSRPGRFCRGTPQP